MLLTKRETIAEITGLAAEAFRYHGIAKEADNVWRCGAANTSIYSYWVMHHPGVIILWGDLGTLTVDAGYNYNLEWLEGAVDSRSYLLEKCSTAKQSKFYPAEFKQLLVWREASNQDMAIAHSDDFSEDAFQEYRYNVGDCDMGEVVYGYPPQVHWQAEALRKFVRLRQAAKIVVVDESADVLS